MDIQDVRKHVAALPDEALLEVEREDLTEAARAVYDEEVSRRGLSWPAAEVAEDDDAEKLAAQGGGLVSVAKFDSVEEGRLARDLLRNEGIPAWFAAELALRKTDKDPLAGLELLTQAAFLEQAQLLLSSEVSEEDLARQAEEAGMLPGSEHEDEA